MITEIVTIADLGTLKRHLGVDWEFGFDKEGHFLQLSMVELNDSIVHDFKSYIGKPLRIFPTPASPGPPLLKLTKREPLNEEEVRSFVGRIMFAVQKCNPGTSNAIRELSGHLKSSGLDHWKVLSHLIGRLKGHYKPLKMRTSAELRVLGFVNSDYASDKNDWKSITGSITTVGGCVVAWQSKKQNSITLSSTESEFVAMSMIATKIKFVVSLLLSEILQQLPKLPSSLQEDNTSPNIHGPEYVNWTTNKTRRHPLQICK